MIYLDNAADAPVLPSVAALIRGWTERTGNPGSIHQAGREAARAINEAREKVAGLFGCGPECIVFTSGGAEGNSMVIHGVISHSSGGGAAAYSAADHDSVIKACGAYGHRAYAIPVRYDSTVGLTDLSEFLARHGDIDLVSIMAVNNETGAVNDIEKIAKLCHANGVLLHTDCVQAVGSIPLDVEKMGCDFAVISGHKFGGPKGVGAVYVRDKSKMSPLIYGGYAQEFGFRGGTENVPGIIGLGEACSLVSVSDRRALLLGDFFHILRTELGERHGLHINGLGAKIMNIQIDGIIAETLLYLLDIRGVCVSAGSACTSTSASPSHVLTSMGLSDEQVSSSIRVSVSSMTTEQELQQAAKITAECVKLLRSQNGLAN